MKKTFACWTVSAGLAAEQRCVWVSPPPSTEALRESLFGLGGDLPTLEASGQLLLLEQVEFYLQDGIFEPERIVALLSSLLEDSRQEGYSTMRVAADVSWLQKEPVDPTAWEILESRLTHEISPLPLVMVSSPPSPGSVVVIRPSVRGCPACRCTVSEPAARI